MNYNYLKYCLDTMAQKASFSKIEKLAIPSVSR